MEKETIEVHKKILNLLKIVAIFLSKTNHLYYGVLDENNLTFI